MPTGLWQRNEGAEVMSAADEPLIGVINAGSSSLKFSIYEGEKRLLAANIDGIGVRPIAIATDANGDPIAPPDFARSVPASPSEVLPNRRRALAVELAVNVALFRTM